MIYALSKETAIGTYAYKEQLGILFSLTEIAGFFLLNLHFRVEEQKKQTLAKYFCDLLTSMFIDNSILLLRKKSGLQEAIVHRNLLQNGIYFAWRKMKQLDLGTKYSIFVLVTELVGLKQIQKGKSHWFFIY